MPGACRGLLSFSTVVILLLLNCCKETSAGVGIGVIYECSYRWDKLAQTRRCPPNNASIVNEPSCLNGQQYKLDENICVTSPIYKDSYDFLHRLDQVMAMFVPDCFKKWRVVSFVSEVCNSPSSTSRLTMRQVFDHVASTYFVDDIFIEDEAQRRRDVTSLTAEILCKTWTNEGPLRSFLSTDTYIATADLATAQLSLKSYLHCAGNLHQASIAQTSFINTTKQLYLAAEISTTILAVLAFFWNLISGIGVWFAPGLSRFRRALLLNLCLTDLANAITICVGEHLHYARANNPYYFVWNILTFEMVVTLFLLTLDFNLAIFQPLRYRYLVSLLATFLIIGASWTFSVALSVAFVFGARSHIVGLEMSALCFYLFGILLVFIAHIVLLLKIFHIQTESQNLIINVVGNKRIIEQTNRVAGTVVLVAVTTLILVVPYCIYEFFLLGVLTSDDPEQCFHRESKLIISELAADICLAVNCVVDPLLYVLRLSDVRKGVQRAWRKFCDATGIQYSFSGTGSGPTPRASGNNNNMNNSGASNSNAPMLIYRPSNNNNNNSDSDTARGSFNNRRPPSNSSTIRTSSTQPGRNNSSAEVPLLPQQRQQQQVEPQHRPLLNVPPAPHAVIQSTRL